MGDFLFYFVFFGPPLAAVIWFVISLILLIRIKKSDPNDPKLGRCRILAIVSGCIAGALVIALALLIMLFMLAMAHM